MARVSPPSALITIGDPQDPKRVQKELEALLQEQQRLEGTINKKVASMISEADRKYQHLQVQPLLLLLLLLFLWFPAVSCFADYVVVRARIAPSLVVRALLLCFPVVPRARSCVCTCVRPPLD